MTASPLAARGELWQHPAFRWTLVASAALALAIAIAWRPISDALYGLEFALAAAFGGDWIAEVAWIALPGVGLVAGLLASLSPCVLPLVPLNVAYIGAADAGGRRAVALSARFVAGAAAALAVLGLFGDLAGWLLIEQRGPVLLASGAVLLYLGGASLELLPLLDLTGVSGSRRLGAFGAGAAFSVVTTPCASPLLGAVLAASATQSVPGLTVASMLAFAIGYTALVFIAGAFGGGLVQALRRRSWAAPRASAAALLIASGLALAASGAAWFV